MKRFLLLTASVVFFFTVGCSDSTPVNVKIGEIGDVEDVLSVRALSGDGKVHLQWELPSDAIGVSIRKSETEFPFSVTSGEEIYAGDGVEFIDEDVILDRRYYYLIVAIDENLNFAGGVKKSGYAFDFRYSGYVYGESVQFIDICKDNDYVYSLGLDSGMMSATHPLFIEKWNRSTGQLEPAFGSDGIVNMNSSLSFTIIFNSIAIDESFIYAGGRDYQPLNFQWRFEKRSKDTGALVSGFGTEGVIQINPSSSTTYQDDCKSIAVDDNYIYAGGDDYSPGNYQWRIEKRSKDTGVLVSGFGTGGVIANNPTSLEDKLQTLTIDDAYIYIGGYDALSSSNFRWRIEKRRKDTGVLEWEISNDVSSGSNDSVLSLKTDGSYIYAGGYVSNNQWRIEKRLKDTGALVSAFGTGGVIEYNFTADQDVNISLEIDNNYIYAGGGNSTKTYMRKYSKSDGSNISSFNYDEAVNGFPANPYDQRNYIKKIILIGNYLYAAGYGFNLTDSCGYILKVDSSTGLLRSGSLIDSE